MASKAHVDNTVNERRLRPIYDWLDNGNNKKALQEAEKVLRKQTDNQCARVLKALALLRLGKEDECRVIMDKVRAEVPCEDSTLQAMSICYREIHQPNKISEIYEAAVKADPNNEEHLTHLFMSYVRLGDYKKQQQTAMALYKLKPKNPYYFWAVMSVVMQAMRADDNLAKGVILPLAERMVLKLVDTGKMEAEQEVQLYLMILELQGKSEDVLKVLSGPLASRLSSVPHRTAVLLLQLERFSEASAAFKELIDQDVDNWACYRDYLAAMLRHSTPDECLKFFNEIAAGKGKRARAPRLARFELLKHTRETKNAPEALEPIDLMRQYFAQFGEKGCVVDDLRLYLHLLTPADRLILLEKITEDVDVKEHEFPVSVEQMQRHIHLEQLKRICGLHHPPNADTEERRRLTNRLCALYSKGNALCPFQDRLPTDFCPADSYALLASHLMHQLWSETNEASYLYRIMALLERCLISSPANFHVKILLVRAYLEAGLIGAANHAFELLDAKHIQLDSLGHLHAPLLAPLGHLSQASATLDYAAKFFVANYKDSVDHLTFAYKYGSFVKIQEFVELRERLENSLHFAMTTVDKMLLELSWCDRLSTLPSILASMHIQPHEDSIRWELLKDNRDLEVVVGWEPLTESEEDPRMRNETRSCMLRLLAVRSLMLRILAATAEPESSSLLVDLSAELKKLEQEHIPLTLSNFEIDETRRRANSPLVPLDAVERLREAYYSKQLNIVTRFADSFSNSTYPDSDCVQALRKSPSVQPLSIPHEESPVSYKPFLLRASTCGETLAILGAMCSSYAMRLQPASFNKKNKKKLNKNVTTLSSDHLQGWSEVGSLLTERLQILDSVLLEAEEHHVQTGLDDKDNLEASIIDRAEVSFVQSCRMLRSRAKSTLQLISGLKS